MANSNSTDLTSVPDDSTIWRRSRYKRPAAPYRWPMYLVPVYMFIAILVVFILRRRARRLRSLAQASAQAHLERQRKLWADEREAMEMAIRALPTRDFESLAEPCEDETGAAAGRDANTGSGSGSTKDENNECAVCLEAFVVGDRIRTLPCKHDFHVSSADTVPSRDRL